MSSGASNKKKKEAKKLSRQQKGSEIGFLIIERKNSTFKTLKISLTVSPLSGLSARHNASTARTSTKPRISRMFV
jgi:hypothetical protein